MICTAVCIISQSFCRTVTLRGNANEMFQGFLVVARNDASQRVGSFTSGGADSKTTCSVSMHKCLRQSQKHYRSYGGAEICRGPTNHLGVSFLSLHASASHMYQFPDMMYAGEMWGDTCCTVNMMELA